MAKPKKRKLICDGCGAVFIRPQHLCNGAKRKKYKRSFCSRPCRELNAKKANCKCGKPRDPALKGRAQCRKCHRTMKNKLRELTLKCTGCGDKVFLKFGTDRTQEQRAAWKCKECRPKQRAPKNRAPKRGRICKYCKAVFFLNAQLKNRNTHRYCSVLCEFRSETLIHPRIGTYISRLLKLCAKCGKHLTKEDDHGSFDSNPICGYCMYLRRREAKDIRKFGVEYLDTIKAIRDIEAVSIVGIYKMNHKHERAMKWGKNKRMATRVSRLKSRR